MIPVALAAGALLYSVWLAELFLDTGLHSVHAYTSELAAFDQPYGWIFRTCDLIAGVVVAVTAACAARKFPSSRLGWWALAVFGVATAVDSQWSLSCSPSSDDACAAAEAAGTVPLTHRLHTVSSTTASAAAVVSAVTLTARTTGALGWAARCATAVLVLATCWTLVAVFTGATVGIAQRVQLLAFASWLVVLATATRSKQECFT